MKPMKSIRPSTVLYILGWAGIGVQILLPILGGPLMGMYMLLFTLPCFIVGMVLDWKGR